MLSSIILFSLIFQNRSQIWLILSTFSISLHLLMVCLQQLSMLLKLLLYFISCLAMSGDSKMGCRYIQFIWSFIHSSIRSDIFFRVLNQFIIYSSKGFLKGEYSMLCVVAMWSSTAAMMSSNVLMMQRLFLNSLNSNLIFSHAFIISCKFFSIANSFVACSPISMQIYACFISPKLSAWLKVNQLSGYTVNPTLSEICFQCLSLNPFFLKAESRGTLGLNQSIWYLILYAILRICTIYFYLNTLMAWFKFLIAS